MRAIVFLGERELQVMDFADPTPGADEVVVEIRASGMCGTDLHHFRGPRRAPEDLVIEGHEPCGVVAEVGAGVDPRVARIGDRVLVHHYDGCGACHHCRSGWTQMCDDSITFGGPKAHGSHARYMKIPAHTLIRMPDDLSFKAGAAISCGTGTAYSALKRIQLAGDETIAVFGQGPVGLSGTQFAKAMGARVIAVDISDERLEIACRLGADVLINPLRDDPVAAIRDSTLRGQGADKTLECSSSQDARRHSIQALKKWGTACVLGPGGVFELEVQEAILNMKTLLGSWTFSKNLLADCADYVVERGIDVEALFTDEYRIEQARKAYELFDQQRTGKGVFVFD